VILALLTWVEIEKPRHVRQMPTGAPANQPRGAHLDQDHWLTTKPFAHLDVPKEEAPTMSCAPIDLTSARGLWAKGALCGCKLLDECRLHSARSALPSPRCIKVHRCGTMMMVSRLGKAVSRGAVSLLVAPSL